MTINSCRFCKKEDYEVKYPLIKYGVRHYACPDCYLDAGKKLSDLHAWQVKKFPYRVLQDRGLLEQTLKDYPLTPEELKDLSV